MSFMKCPNCGKEIDKESTNCIYCGFSFETSEQSNSSGINSPNSSLNIPVNNPTHPIICGKCGFQNKEGFEYCAKCGAKIIYSSNNGIPLWSETVQTKTCRSCKAKIPKSSRKCPICGKSQSDNTVLIILPIILVSIIFMFLIMFFVTYFYDEQESIEISTETESMGDTELIETELNESEINDITDIDSTEIDIADTPDLDETTNNGTESTIEYEFQEAVNIFNSGEYRYVTNMDLNKYHENMNGVKIYVVIDIDDMKDGMIQSTLDDGFMMSNFYVDKDYSDILKTGDMVAIFGEVGDYSDYGFMGKSININNCQVFACGEEAMSYVQGSSDSKLNEYFTVTEDVAESNSNDNISEDEFKNLCETLNYEDILRNPDSYNDKHCVVSGTVSQIIEGYFGSYSIFITDTNGNMWGCTYFYEDGESHLLEGDNVKVYGLCDGTTNARTILNKQVTMPYVQIEYIN